MPFGLKNVHFEFQNMMNYIFNYYTKFSIVYIYDVLVFSNSYKSISNMSTNFKKNVRKHGLVISAIKINYFKQILDF